MAKNVDPTKCVMIDGTMIPVADAIHIFDMDGVLFRYDRTAYQGEDARWLQPGFFRDLPEDPYFVTYAMAIAQWAGMKRIFVLTSLPDADDFTVYRIKKEKQQSLDRTFGKGTFIENKNVFYVPYGVNKHDFFATHVKVEEDCPVILYDDRNENLNLWNSYENWHGVKYINGVNSAESYDGDVFYRSEICKQFDDAFASEYESCSMHYYLAFFPYDNMYVSVVAETKKRAEMLLSHWYPVQWKDAELHLADEDADIDMLMQRYPAYFEQSVSDVVTPFIQLSTECGKEQL